MCPIFISYRSADIPFGAAFLDEALTRHFGAENVFRDSRSVRPGDRFDSYIIQALRESSVMLVLIGPGWFGKPDAQGRRKIDDPNDFVHRELVEAFEHDLRVVPVLMGVDRLAAADLPSALQQLAAVQDRTVRAQESAADVSSLIASLVEFLPNSSKEDQNRVRHPDPVIHANRIGAVFNESVHVSRDLNIN